MAEALKKHSDWGRSYGEMVSGEFFKSSINIGSLIFIITLFVIAVLAPFLANDKPLVIRIEGELAFPLLRDLNAVDYSVFIAAVMGLFQVWLVRRNRRRVNPSRRI